MKAEQRHTYEKVILGLQLFGFGAVLLVLWLDEYIDVPFRFFGALQTPARPQEFWFEAVVVLLVATAVVAATLWVFRRLRFLAGFIQVCAWCRKVEVEGDWIAFEQSSQARARCALDPRHLPDLPGGSERAEAIARASFGILFALA